MRVSVLGAALAACVLAAPALAQDRRQPQRTGQPSPLAQQAMAGGQQPDVLLDVPNLSVDEITLEVSNLRADIALDARLANLLKLTAGANVGIDQVKIGIKGVQAQATLIVRLENVRAIIERTLQTLDNNPQIVTQLLNTVDNTVGTVGGVANNAVGTVGGVANNAVGAVGQIAGSALRTGQVLNLGQLGLSQLGQTVNAAGQTVRQVRDRSGAVLEVVTDQANRIVSSRALPRQ
ncbi:hypothetical protein [Sphingomonas lenta]|uniref:hypothetical protein n=1 Tax=Sphingomonas lenta TaxID=1141887 RepID=UPI001C3EB471|nr:hypothetical protein [Sphingomonas lenta]